MFGFFKKPKTASEQNEAALTKLKKLMDQELISRDCLKKMYETSLNLVTSGINCNITLVGMVIR